MRCPTDQTTLRTANIDGLRVSHCPTCTGVWCAEEYLREMVQRFRENQVSHEMREFINEVPEGAVLPDASGEPRTCPACGASLERYHFEGRHDLRLDTCRACGGMWFDGSELAQLYRYVHTSEAEHELARAIAKWPPPHSVAQELTNVGATVHRGAYLLTHGLHPMVFVVMVVYALAQLFAHDASMRERYGFGVRENDDTPASPEVS